MTTHRTPRRRRSLHLPEPVLWLLAVGACSNTPPATDPSGLGTGSQAPTGCFESDRSDSYRSVRLCLGPPTLPEGRFSLSDQQVVPDATLSEVLEGGYTVQDGRLVLRAERSRTHSVNEQLGTANNGEGNADVTLTAVVDATAATITLGRPDRPGVTLARTTD